MRSASKIASSTSCVIMNTVCCVSRTMLMSSSWMVPRVSASSAPNGSSSSSILGLMANARAMPTRCFMPPDSCDGFLSMAGSRPTMPTNFSTCALTCARVQPGQRDSTANAMFLRTVSQGMSAWLWNTTPRSRLGPTTSRPSMKTWPLVAVSSPASTFRMVVLPQPEWPMMQTNSPRSSVNDTLANTGLAGREGLGQALNFQEALHGRIFLECGRGGALVQVTPHT
jgi:hypothetical protein